MVKLQLEKIKECVSERTKAQKAFGVLMPLITFVSFIAYSATYKFNSVAVREWEICTDAFSASMYFAYFFLGLTYIVPLPCCNKQYVSFVFWNYLHIFHPKKNLRDFLAWLWDCDRLD